jgi:hypothetical protein
MARDFGGGNYDGKEDEPPAQQGIFRRYSCVGSIPLLVFMGPV